LTQNVIACGSHPTLQFIQLERYRQAFNLGKQLQVLSRILSR